MSIIRWNPARELLNVERDFNKLFRSFENRFGFPKTDDIEEPYESASWMPLTDISELEDKYILRIDLPGISKEDVKISYKDGQISISGERRQENEVNNSKYHRVERTFGKFFRSFTLPERIKEENINAEFKNGQLMIEIPKSEEVKPKEIEIKVS